MICLINCESELSSPRWTLTTLHAGGVAEQEAGSQGHRHDAIRGGCASEFLQFLAVQENWGAAWVTGHARQRSRESHETRYVIISVVDES